MTSTIDILAEAGYLVAVDRVLAGEKVKRALTVREQILVAHRITWQGGDVQSVAIVLGVPEETATELVQVGIRLCVPLDAVRCVVCGCAGGMLVVGECVSHGTRRCALVPYKAPVRLASLAYFEAIGRWAA